ncbi:carboxylesterase/lipase family protein [Actinomadura nitritigenes]|uniref:carboxylesterase/lipase family protein n=1 Tax=Actinomadura nitritigenes TaxID=134602 RepID=UPI003D932F8E
MKDWQDGRTRPAEPEVPAAGVPAAAADLDGAVPADCPVVATEYGPVVGTSEQGLSVFRGIPYAAPPVGERRFLPPVAPTKWTEPRDATTFGPACPQIPDEHEMAEGTPTSEDCLTLNVWTPTVQGAKPVIVFIHGGGFTSGSAHDPWYDGASLARRDAVVITIQYRVGPFGWLDVSCLGDEYGQSMNNGLLDQMAALRWVRANAAAFGGDGRNVTVVGESAGAISISALLGTPSADDLYDRAILQSGTAGTVATAEWAGRVGSRFLELAGLSDAGELLHLSTEKILEAATALYDTQFSDTAFGPVVDGALIPELPMKRLASPDGPTKPVIIGTNLDEARYWLYYIPEMDRLPRRYFEPWLRSLVGDRADHVIGAYRSERPELSIAQVGMALSGDVGFRMPSVRMAEALSGRGVPVHLYLATVTSPDLDGAMGSPHAIELPFVFGTLSAEKSHAFTGTDPSNERLAETIQQLWTSFARLGTPTAVGVSWPLYDTTQRPTLVLDRTAVEVKNDPYPQARTAWGDMRFDGSDPALDRLTPLQYEGTNPHDPLVITAVLGWKRLVPGALAAAGLITGAVCGVRLLLRRRTGS